MRRDKTYFISDLHLGAGYVADVRAHERRVTRFLRSIADDAARLIMLGDVLDYWFEYRDVVPRGFVRFFGELARLSDSGVEIVWLTGNHDIWLFDYLRDEIGLTVIDAPMVVDEIDGKKFLLAHGDRVGDRKASFKFLCSLFRNRVCQKLYSGIHPRWTVPFARRWSRHSRAGGDSSTRAACLAAAEDMLRAVPDADYVVMGHHHIAINEPVADSRARLIVLGDWLSHDTYGVFDGHEFLLKKFEIAEQ